MQGVKYRRVEPNQLDPRLLSLMVLNPFIAGVSSSRAQMFGSHIGQALVIEGAGPRSIQSGYEDEFGKYTLSVKMPCNGRIIKEVERYPETHGGGGFKYSPGSAVLYEDVDTKEIGILFLPRYNSHHQYFGFPYAAQPAMGKIKPNAEIAKDEVFLDTPSKKDGQYGIGIEVPVAFMTHHAVAEDGIIINRDWLEKFAIHTTETRDVSWGSRYFPLNLYGDENNYKPFPDIGDYVRPDGLLMMLREQRDHLCVVEQNINSVRQIEPIFDKAVYADAGYGRVIDIRVYCGSSQVSESIIDAQPRRYLEATRQYYEGIMSAYRRLLHERGKSLRITPELSRFVTEAYALFGYRIGSTVEHTNKTYKRTPLDDWRVEFVIEYRKVPEVGFKATDTHGGK